LSVLETELAAARQEGFVPKRLLGNNEKHPTKKVLLVVGVMTTFGRRKNRDAIRKAWMPAGTFVVVLISFYMILHIGIISFIRWNTFYVPNKFIVDFNFVVWFPPSMIMLLFLVFLLFYHFQYCY